MLADSHDFNLLDVNQSNACREASSCRVGNEKAGGLDVPSLASTKTILESFDGAGWMSMISLRVVETKLEP
jgi:hypothetical protein